MDIPLYSDSASVWSTAIEASPTVSMIFLNPSNGPGTSPQTFYSSLVSGAHSRGVRVLGYVATSWANGSVSISNAEVAISKYYSWYGVDGIFLDEVNDACDLAPVSYYTTLYDFVKQQPGANLVVLNPGTSVGECYAKISDVLITFEDSYANFLTHQEAAWVGSYPATHFLNIVIDAPTVCDMMNAVNLARIRNVNGVYITDRGANGTSPYSSLPSYFALEVLYLAQPLMMGTQRMPVWCNIVSLSDVTEMNTTAKDNLPTPNLTLTPATVKGRPFFSFPSL